MKTRRIFKPSDTLSNDGMLTTVWGPAIWHFLHTMSFNYPVHPTQEQKVQYRDFILQLEHVLPCKYCRMNLTKNFKTLPLSPFLTKKSFVHKYADDSLPLNPSSCFCKINAS